MDDTPIRITVADRMLTAWLADSATARDLLGRLPLSLRFKDFNSVEKIATLDPPLDLRGAPEGADPDIGDIAYYSPGRNLVLYYGDVGYWKGIVPIGRFDPGFEIIEAQPDGFEVRIERG